jgi:hypothetical protein
MDDSIAMVAAKIGKERNGSQMPKPPRDGVTVG